MTLRPFFFAPIGIALALLASGCASMPEVTQSVAAHPARITLNTAALPIAGAKPATATAAAGSAAPSLATAQSAKEALATRAANSSLAVDYWVQLTRANVVLKNNSKDAYALLDRARANFELENYKAAKPDYVAALRTTHGHPDLYYNKAVNELMLTEFDLAANDFTSALRLRPNDKEALLGRGIAKMQLSKYRGAVADFTHALAIDSLYAAALQYRGISYASYDCYEQARYDLEKAAKLNP